jgi:hypothetical protein
MRRHRARRGGGSGSFMATGANAGGGALMAAADQYLYGNETVAAVIGDGVLKPVVNGVIGHFVKRKAPNVGAGIVGVAGYQLAMVLFDSMEAAPAAETAGVYDVGSLRRRNAHAARAHAGLPPYHSRRHNFDAAAIFDPAYVE